MNSHNSEKNNNTTNTNLSKDAEVMRDASKGMFKDFFKDLAYNNKLDHSVDYKSVNAMSFEPDIRETLDRVLPGQCKLMINKTANKDPSKVSELPFQLFKCHDLTIFNIPLIEPNVSARSKSKIDEEAKLRINSEIKFGKFARRAGWFSYWVLRRWFGRDWVDETEEVHGFLVSDKSVYSVDSDNVYSFDTEGLREFKSIMATKIFAADRKKTIDQVLRREREQKEMIERVVKLAEDINRNNTK